MTTLAEKCSRIPSHLWQKMKHGIEKESLRVSPDGMLSMKGHPPALGSSLTHPLITTDFSEAQLELVTGAHTSVEKTLEELRHTHQFVYQNIGDELMWATSMPCKLPDDKEIPIGQFGTSNIGRAKTVYRNGLTHRYGSRMQTISGVHYNFSLPDEAWSLLMGNVNGKDPKEIQTNGYFSLIRNFKRHSWLLLYLFGASPAVCGTFVKGREHRLSPIGKGCLHLPYGTSLRMGPLGYQSNAQDSLSASFNSLKVYAESLLKGLTVPYPPYEDIGICVDDEYRQLSTTLLQIENEYYSSIRPKRRIHSGERALHALGERGVEYIEVRCLDIDPFDPIGVSPSTSYFMDLFLLHCLLSESPNDTKESLARNKANQLLVAAQGRDPKLLLTHTNGQQISLKEWALELFAEFTEVAKVLDTAVGRDVFGVAARDALELVNDVEKTPSAKVLTEMSTKWSNSYPDFAMDRSFKNREALMATPFPDVVNNEFIEESKKSLMKQKEIEDNETIDFETFRQSYVTQDVACGC